MGRGERSRSMSIISHGLVRPVKPGELAKGDEDNIEKESKRIEQKEYASKTRTLKGFVIVDMIHVNSIDSIVVRRLRDLHETLLVNNLALAIARPRPSVLKYLILGQFVGSVGQDFVVDSVHHCSIRCNAVLRAAKRYQARKLIEEEMELAKATQNDVNNGTKIGNDNNV